MNFLGRDRPTAGQSLRSRLCKEPARCCWRYQVLTELPYCCLSADSTVPTLTLLQHLCALMGRIRREETRHAKQEALRGGTHTGGSGGAAGAATVRSGHMFAAASGRRHGGAAEQTTGTAARVRNNACRICPRRAALFASSGAFTRRRTPFPRPRPHPGAAVGAAFLPGPQRTAPAQRAPARRPPAYLTWGR